MIENEDKLPHNNLKRLWILKISYTWKYLINTFHGKVDNWTMTNALTSMGFTVDNLSDGVIADILSQPGMNITREEFDNNVDGAQGKVFKYHVNELLKEAAGYTNDKLVMIQMVAIGILLSGDTGNKIINFENYNAQTIGIILLWLSAALTLFTGYDYLRKGIDHAISEDNKD